MSNVTFITGNQNKADHLAKFLGIDVAHQKVELDEIQSSDPHDIVRHKVLQAYEILKTPVLVEDVSLGFAALDGLPGPFVKFFIESKHGAENMCRMIDSFDDRTATARCLFGFYDGIEVSIFEDTCAGKIARTPRGTSGYGWDVIFEMDGMDGKTNAELTAEQYDVFQTSLKPFDQLRNALSNR